MKKRKSVACIIYNSKKILIAQRNLCGNMAGLWEFPGGKVENGETDEDAIVREMKEEFGTDVKVGKYIASSSFMNEDKTYSLSAYEVFAVDDGIKNRYKLTEHLDYRWVELFELDNFPFVDSDKKLFPSVKSFIEDAYRHEL